MRAQLNTILVVLVHQDTEQRLGAASILDGLSSEPHLALAVASTASIVQVVSCFKVELAV